MTLVLATATANADEKGACIDAHVRAQVLERDGKWIAARDAFTQCAKPSCPGVVQADCGEELQKIDARIPSVVVEGRDAAGHDTADVEVTVDGTVAAPRLTGVAFPLDPGEHVLSFRSEGERLEQKLFAVEGEQRRRVVADFSTLHPRASLAPPSPPSPPGAVVPGAPASATARPVPGSVYAFGVAALVGLASFGALAVAGDLQKSSAYATCAPGCGGRYDTLLGTYAAADAALGTGVVALSVATILYLARPSRPVARTGGLVRGVAFTW